MKIRETHQKDELGVKFPRHVPRGEAQTEEPGTVSVRAELRHVTDSENCND